MPIGAKVGDGYILVKPVLDKTELAKTQAEAAAAFKRSVNQQLGFNKVANNEFLESARKLAAQKQKAETDTFRETQRAHKASLAERGKAEQEAQRLTVSAFRDSERLKTAITKAGDDERNNNSSKSLAAHVRNLKTFTPNFVPLALGGVTALPAALGTVANILPAVTAGLAIIPTLFASAAVSVGVLGIALHGLSGAWTALDNDQQSAGTGAALAAEQLASAQKSVRTATESLSKAQRDAKQAILDQKDAQDALNQSYVDAANNLADLDLRQKRNSLDLLDAQDAQIQAQQGLINAQSTGDPNKIAQAQRSLDEANQSLAEQRQQIKENSEENAKAVAKGVAGSDQVTQAQKQLKDANQAILDSNQQVRDATENLADAQQKLADHLSGATGAAKTLNNALNALAPNARAVVVGLHDALGQGSGFATSIQDAFFAPFVSGNFVGQVKSLAGQLKGPLDAVAKSMGYSFTSIFSSLTSPKSVAAILQVVDGVKDFTRSVTPGAKALADSLLVLSGKGGSLGGQAGGFISDLLKQFSGFLDKIDIKSLFTSAKPIIDSLVGTVKNLGDALKNVFKIAGQTNFLSIFQQLSKTIDDFTKSKEGQAALTALFKALNSIGGGAAKILAEALGIVGQVLISASPYIGPFVDSLVQLLQTLAPLAEPLGKLAGLVLQELTVALQDLTPVIQPLIAAFADFLNNYLDDALVTFGQLVALLPSLKPLFDQITSAIAILLPPALKLTDQFFRAVGAQLPGLVTSFSQLLLAVLPLVTPITQLLALFLSNPVGLAVFRGALEAITIAWGGLAAVIQTVVDAYNAVARVIHLPTISAPAEAKKLVQQPVQAFGAKGFSEGGYTGDGGVNQPAGIVHAGEYVVPQTMSMIFPTLEAIRTNGPRLRDSGGTVPPGLSLVANHTGKHETIRTADQERALGGGDTYVTVMIDGQEFQGRIDTSIQKRERQLGKQFQGK